MKIGGLDIGTTGCKLTIFSEQGKYIDKAYCDYPIRRKTDGHEVDVSVIMQAVLSVIKAMAQKYPDIAGIGVTSFGETFVMTDAAGQPLHNAMLYTDMRGREECLSLTGKLGGKQIAGITGLRPHEMYSISKMMWIKKHLPEIYSAAHHIFLMQDYVVFHLTGIAQIDYSLATRTMAFDIRAMDWSEEIFQTAGIKKTLMSRTVQSGTDAGAILPEIAQKTGLHQGTRVISVSHDQVAAAVGAGVFDSDKAVDGAGTVECMTPVYDEIPDLDVMYEGYYAVVPYVIPRKYVCYAFSYTGGALVQWCVDTFAKQEKILAERKGISVNELLEGQSEEPTGILVLPHFAGAATPYMDTGSKGAILGLNIEHSVSDVYRACMEGVVYEMVLNMEYLKESGVHFQILHATGGGAKSKVFMQMKADILNIPIVALKTVDAGTVGSAMLTGIAAGFFKDLEDAAAHMVEEGETYYPREDMHQKYTKLYRRYKQVYHAVRPLV